MYSLRYEAWGLSDKCAYSDKPVTPWDLDHNQGHFAELLDYYSAIFKFLCVVLFTIICTEYFVIYYTKRDKLMRKTADKIIVARRVICVIMAKIGFVVVSYMSANTESGKFA